MINTILRSLVRNICNSLFRGKDPFTLILAVIIILLLIVSFPKAQLYEYKGVYPVQSVLINYCQDCFLQLPPEFLQSNIVLSVETDKEKDLFKALVSASKAIGWDLKRVGKNLVAEPSQNQGNLTYISCLTYDAIDVPKYLYSYAVKADSIKCAKRDSLALFEINRQDSIAKYNDSLQAIFLGFKTYELRYYSYSKSFTDRIGFEWNQILAEGNLHNKFKIYDNWAFYATENNDTSFTFRRIILSLDSSLTLDWGTEEQTLLNSYVSEGVTSNNYEWRKYGLIVNISKDDRRVMLDYTFRDKANSISVLQGKALGNLSDTLKVFGQYLTSRQVNQGIPILSQIPLIKYLFSDVKNQNDLNNFELYLIPSFDFSEFKTQKEETDKKLHLNKDEESEEKDESESESKSE